MENSENIIENTTETKPTPQLLAVTQLMQGHPIAILKLQYFGYGDSMDYFDVFQGDSTQNFSPVEIPALTEALEALVASKFENFYDGNGGFGEVVIRLEETKVIVEWSHSFNATEEVNQDVSIPSEDAQTIRTLLTEMGVDSVSLDYCGGGDSMDGLSPVYMHKGSEITPQSNGAPGIAQSEVVKILDRLICDQCSGFWNDEGGKGRMFLSLEGDSCVEWDHTDFSDSTEDTRFTWIYRLPDLQESAA